MSMESILARAEKERELWRYTSLKDIASAPLETGTRELFFTASKHRVERATSLGVEAAEKNGVLDVSVKTGVSAILIERFASPEKAQGIETPVLKMSLGEGASLLHVRMVTGAPEAVFLGESEAVLARGASLYDYSLLAGRRLARNEMSVRLAGDGSSVKLAGLMCGAGKRQVDTVCSVIHEAIGTKSQQAFRSVLDDHSKGVFLGRIFVRPHAQKTDGYQMSRALLLSDQAEMVSRPDLVIEADDVKCGHGSAVGDLDEAALFYLRARGLEAEAARTLLIAAFAREAFDGIDEVELRRELFTGAGLPEDEDSEEAQ